MPAFTFVKLAAVIVTLSATLLSATAEATPIVYTATGTIQTGYDSTGVFGAAGDLSGKAYSLAFTVDPALYNYQYSSSATNYGEGALTGKMTETITVNGVAKTYAIDPTKYNWGETYVSTGTSFNEIYQYQSGTTTGGLSLTSYAYIYDYFNNAALAAASFTSLSYQSVSADVASSYFSLSGTSTVSFSSNALVTISIKAANDVPEPAPLALLGLGLVALGASRRKTRA